jgi:hypothetical protein
MAHGNLPGYTVLNITDPTFIGIHMDFNEENRKEYLLYRISRLVSALTVMKKDLNAGKFELLPIKESPAYALLASAHGNLIDTIVNF